MIQSFNQGMEILAGSLANSSLAPMARIAVERVDDFEQLRLRRALGEQPFEGGDARLRAGLDLPAHVDHRGRILSDAHDSEAGRDAVLGDDLRRCACNLFANQRCDRLAIDHHCLLLRAVLRCVCVGHARSVNRRRRAVQAVDVRASPAMVRAP